MIIPLVFFASWFVMVALEKKGAKTDDENKPLSWLYKAFLAFIFTLIIYGLLTI